MKMTEIQTDGKGQRYPAMARVMTAVLNDDTELFKQFSDNASFRRWLTDTVFALTYKQPSV
jgi:type I restriction enzyme R subunit